MITIDSKEFAELIKYDGSICRECAEFLGAVWPVGHVATQWTGTCSVCEREKMPCCAISDWEWPAYRGQKAPREI